MLEMFRQWSRVQRLVLVGVLGCEGTRSSRTQGGIRSEDRWRSQAHRRRGHVRSGCLTWKCRGGQIRVSPGRGRAQGRGGGGSGWGRGRAMGSTC